MVSILLPSYNHAAYLGDCLASVFGQSFEDWELIAIDDGSSDRSLEVLREQTDPRVRVLVNEQNLGTYGTLDRALSMAHGHLVAVLNSDDWWSSDKLRLQVELLDQNPMVQVAYTYGFAVAEDGTKIEPRTLEPAWPAESIQELLPLLLAENHVLASSVVFRKHSARFRPELRYSGDWVALLAPARDGPLGFVPGPQTMWRQHGRNTYIRSSGQVQEEVLVRESILGQATWWEVPRLPKSAVRRGLSECALHLSALYVLQGRMVEARQIARAAVRFQPGKRSLRRLAAVSLSSDVSRRRLWGQEPIMPRGPERDPISFP